MSASVASDKVAVVTGATSGIGLAVSDSLLSDGYTVFGVGRRSAPSSAPSHYRHFACDFSDLDACSVRFRELREASGAPSAVILAAGYGRFGSLEEFSAEQIRRLIDVNLTAHVLLCRELLPSMKSAGRGHIVVLGSESALRSRRQGTVYSASKFALRGFAQALRDEVAKNGLRVTSIHPGMVRTPFFDDLDFEPGPDARHALSADDVCAAVRYALNTPQSSVVDEIELSPLQTVVRKR